MTIVGAAIKREYPRRSNEAYVVVSNGENCYTPCVLAPIMLAEDGRLEELENAYYAATEAVLWVDTSMADGRMVWVQNLLLSERYRRPHYMAVPAESIMQIHVDWPEDEHFHHYDLLK